MPASTRTMYRAKESFTIDYEGAPLTIRGGVDIIEEGHPIMRGHEHLFEPVKADYEVEEATAAPGSKRKR